MLRIKKYLESKFVKNVSGVRVNYLTLMIYNNEVQQEYEEHINSNQFQKWTFWIFTAGNLLNIVF